MSTSALATVQVLSTSVLKNDNDNDADNDETTKPSVEGKVVFGEGCVVGPTSFVELKTVITTDVTTATASPVVITVNLIFGKNNIVFETGKISIAVNIDFETPPQEDIELNLHVGDCNQFGIGSLLDVSITASSTSTIHLIGSHNVLESRSKVSLSSSDTKQLVGDVNSFGILTATSFSNSAAPISGHVFYRVQESTKFRVLEEAEQRRTKAEIDKFDCGDERRNWEATEAAAVE